MAKAGKTHRGVIFRLLLNEEQEHQLHGICGGCRFVWNFFLARNQKEYAESQANGTPAPSTRYEHLSGEFTQLRNDLEGEVPWLRDSAYAYVRHTVRELSQAFENCFAGRARKPRFHAKHKTTPSFTIPQDVKIKDGKIWITNIQWVRIRRRGDNPYPDGVPKQARVTKRGNKWYVSVNYEID